MIQKHNTPQERTGDHKSPEDISYERLIEQHAQRGLVKEKAAEIAGIGSRASEDIREEDREQAWDELAATPEELPNDPPPRDAAPTSRAERANEPQTMPEEDERLLRKELARRGVPDAKYSIPM